MKIKSKLKIDLGAGYYPTKGFLNVDFEKINIKGYRYIRANLNKRLPFKDNSVDEIYSSHFLEHVQDLYNLMNEIKRICCNGAKIKIIVPHFTSLPYEFHVREFKYDMLLDYVFADNNSITIDKIYNTSMLKKKFIHLTKKKLVFKSVYSIMNIINLHPLLCRWYECSFLRSFFFCDEIIFEGYIEK